MAHLVLHKLFQLCVQNDGEAAESGFPVDAVINWIMCWMAG